MFLYLPLRPFYSPCFLISFLSFLIYLVLLFLKSFIFFPHFLSSSERKVSIRGTVWLDEARYLRNTFSGPSHEKDCCGIAYLHLPVWLYWWKYYSESLPLAGLNLIMPLFDIGTRCKFSGILKIRQLVWSRCWNKLLGKGFFLRTRLSFQAYFFRILEKLLRTAEVKLVVSLHTSSFWLSRR